MTVKHHVQRMQEAGVLEIGKRNDQFCVSLTRPNLRIVEEPEPEAPTEAETVDQADAQTTQVQP
jgi:hypothetical protein